MAREILVSGSGAASSDSFLVAPGDTVTVLLINAPPGASDKIHIQYTPDNSNWYTLKENGADRDLDFNNNVQRITGPVKARVDRPSGNSKALGAALATRANP